MSRKNPCPHPNCDTLKAYDMYACKRHWFTLPRYIRDAIWKAYTNKGALSPEWTAAHEEAQAFWKAHP